MTFWMVLEEAGTQLWMTLLDPKLYQPAGVTWGEKASSFLPAAMASVARSAPGHATRGGTLRRPHHQTQDGRSHPPIQSTATPRKPVRLAGPSRKERVGMGRLEEGHHQRFGIRRCKRKSHPRGALAIQGAKPPLAVEIVKWQTALPWEWRSTPDVIDEIPGLKAKLTNAQGVVQRGGLVNQLKVIIDRLATRRWASAVCTSITSCCLTAGLSRRLACGPSACAEWLSCIGRRSCERFCKKSEAWRRRRLPRWLSLLACRPRRHAPGMERKCECGPASGQAALSSGVLKPPSRPWLPALQWRQPQRHQEPADAYHCQEDPQAGLRAGPEAACPALRAVPRPPGTTSP